MSLPNIEWSTSYPASQDADPISSSGIQDQLTNETSPGAGDGHNTRVSHPHALRDKLQEVCKKAGDSSDLPAGSNGDRIATLEGKTLPILAAGTPVLADALVLNLAGPLGAIDSGGGVATLIISLSNDPQLKWASPTAVDIEPVAGPGTVTKPFADGKSRAFTGTITFDPSLGTVDGGLDVGAEAADTWYYLYLVPDGGDDDLISVRGSVTTPDIGPTGFPLAIYIGAVRNNGASDLIEFCQNGSHFWWVERQEPAASLGLPGVPTHPAPPAHPAPVPIPITDLVPGTAKSANVQVQAQVDASGAPPGSDMHIETYAGTKGAGADSPVGIYADMLTTSSGLAVEFTEKHMDLELPILAGVGPLLGYRSWPAGPGITIGPRGQHVFVVGWTDVALGFGI